MSAPAPGSQDREGDQGGYTPDRLLISFAEGMVTGSVRASYMSVDTWDGFCRGQDGVATVALRFDDIALHIGQTADDLRHLSDACLRAAATLDAGQ